MLIKNARLISPGVDLPGAAVEIDGSVIKAVYPAGSRLPKAGTVLDAAGQMVMPGFIDIHIHGSAGFDFCDATVEAVEAITKFKMRQGTTTLLPTTMLCPPEKLKKTAECVAQYTRNPRFAKTPGLHLEGPFVSPNQLGALNPEFIRRPDIEEVRSLHAVMPVSIVSMSIEVPGALELIRELGQMGIVASAAHSGAKYEQFKAAKAAGMRHLTHFCNQMSPLHHREIGLVGSGLIDDDVLLEIICDRIHLCPAMVALILKLKPARQIVLISDSVSAAGLPDGRYKSGGLDIEVKDNTARLISNGALAGSTLSLNQALKNAYEISGLPLSELVCTTSWNQAQSLGLKGLGKIEPGYTADLVVLNAQFDPSEVFIDGKPQLK